MKSPHKWNELYDKGFRKERTCNRAPTHEYRVTKPQSVDWPEDEELISFCDDGPGMNFGGQVIPRGDEVAFVRVYVD